MCHFVFTIWTPAQEESGSLSHVVEQLVCDIFWHLLSWHARMQTIPARHVPTMKQETMCVVRVWLLK